MENGQEWFINGGLDFGEAIQESLKTKSENGRQI